MHFTYLKTKQLLCVVPPELHESEVPYKRNCTSESAPEAAVQLACAARILAAKKNQFATGPGCCSALSCYPTGLNLCDENKSDECGGRTNTKV
jgi:hypothetical protein